MKSSDRMSVRSPKLRSMRRARGFRQPWVAVGVGVFMALGCRGRLQQDETGTSVASATPVDPCEAGRSLDPKMAEFNPAVTAFHDREYVRAQQLLDQIIAKFPHSSTARVWRAEASLYEFKLSDGKERYVGAAETALGFYAAAERLHERGCQLPEMELYYLRMGTAYAELRKGEAERALSVLAVGRKTWPDSAEIPYTAARAYCAKGELDRCVGEFERTLTLASSLKRPMFLRTHRSLEDWINRSRTQSEFTRLRQDRRYAEVIGKARLAAE